MCCDQLRGSGDLRNNPIYDCLHSFNFFYSLFRQVCDAFCDFSFYCFFFSVLAAINEKKKYCRLSQYAVAFIYNNSRLCKITEVCTFFSMRKIFVHIEFVQTERTQIKLRFVNKKRVKKKKNSHRQNSRESERFCFYFSGALALIFSLNSHHSNIFYDSFHLNNRSIMKHFIKKKKYIIYIF